MADGAAREARREVRAAEAEGAEPAPDRGVHGWAWSGMQLNVMAAATGEERLRPNGRGVPR